MHQILVAINIPSRYGVSPNSSKSHGAESHVPDQSCHFGQFAQLEVETEPIHNDSILLCVYIYMHVHVYMCIHTRHWANIVIVPGIGRMIKKNNAVGGGSTRSESV
jgi:hypothetical protein